MKKISEIVIFKEGELIPPQFLKFYHENKLVDVGAITSCRGTILTCHCGFVVFVYGKGCKGNIIYITDRSSEGFSNHGYAEDLYISNSIHDAENDYDIERVYSCGVKPKLMSEYNEHQ